MQEAEVAKVGTETLASPAPPSPGNCGILGETCILGVETCILGVETCMLRGPAGFIGM